MGDAYSALRAPGYPTAYAPLKTAVTVDVLELGFITAWVIVILSFILVIPGIRGWQRWFSTIRFFIGSYLLLSIMLSLYGMEWEVAELHDVPTYYKAFEKMELEHAEIGVKIGLNAVNITLKADKHNLTNANETVDYNERFHFYGGQGLTGFGRFAGRINREFREAQWLGKPYPILWVAEYFTLDGEDIRWGRSYRMAGYYTWIMLWTSFPLYIISCIFFFNVIRYGAYFLMGTGAFMLTGNILYATVRYGSEMKIPFTDEKVLIFHKGASFYVCLVAGLVAVILGLVIVILDYYMPEKISEFFNVDPLIDYEETFVYEGENEKGETPIVDASKADEPVESKPQFRQRTKTKKGRRQPKPAPRQSMEPAIEEAEEPEEPVQTHTNGMNGDKPATNGDAAITMSELELKEKEEDAQEEAPATTEESAQ